MAIMITTNIINNYVTINTINKNTDNPNKLQVFLQQEQKH